MRFDTPYNQRKTPPHRESPHDEAEKNTRAQGNTPEATVENAPAPLTSGNQEAHVGSRHWNTWWSRRSPNLRTNDNEPVCIGIDAGSKTLKIVALDRDGNVVFSEYHRHRSDVRAAVAELLHDVIWRYGDWTLPLAVTGSAGIALAEAFGLPFVQEVVAATNAVRKRYPHADCVIELGGEDAKITYLAETPEHRMNATCAGGTGDFIDGIASMLGVKTREMSKLAMSAQRTYPIASRCAVFAQTDVRPLINAGATKADIAQSALEAVVRQTLGGLACGRPIRGTVVFLGGPLEHIPALVMCFRRKLGLNADTGIKPPDANLFCAIGAIESAENPPAIALSELERRARKMERLDEETGFLPPLFDDPGQQEAFMKRHAGQSGAAKRLENLEGPLFLGFDAGSTSMKYALVDQEGAIVSHDYRMVEGDTFATARTMLEELLTAVYGGPYASRPRRIVRAVVTGYGEDLLRTGLGFDEGVVETAAHLRAARHYRPDVSFMLDIGGQDMKALWIQDGTVVDAVLNEACSSGCGAFVQSSAKSLGLSHEDFSRQALAARRPIDLGAKCTVFMTSRVRHAQKAGADPGDIAAGIAYSVVNNALTRIIGADRAATMGDVVVVQGGTFKSDAVLRAFEKATGVHAVRPDKAHLMGAYGAALIARDHHTGAPSSLPSLDQVRSIHPKRMSLRCAGCGNACLLSVVEFGNDKRFISGNRCERAREVMFGSKASPAKERQTLPTRAPNVVELEQKLLSRYSTAVGKNRRSDVVVGFLNVLNTYENTPFWHTLFVRLGFSVAIPDDEHALKLADKAAESIPSESVCYPAKLAHRRYEQLLSIGATVVFMPRFERGTRCPVSCEYATVIASNAPRPEKLSSPTLRAIRPRSLALRQQDRQALFDEIAGWTKHDELTREEFDAAFDDALHAQEDFEETLVEASNRVRAWLQESPDRRAAIIAGRPYHCDPALIGGIDRELAKIGFAVVPLLSIERLREHTQWKPAKHLVGLVRHFADDPQVEIVAIRSFGCGYDAVSFDEARDVARALNRPFTELKIDDMSDTAHIRIRLRTLAYTSHNRDIGSAVSDASASNANSDIGTASITPDLCSTAKALVERAIREWSKAPELACLQVPDVCKDCLTDALPFELRHMLSKAPSIEKTSSPGHVSALAGSIPRVGLLGNPLLVFNPDLNDHVEDLLRKLGCQAVYPDPSLIEVEDVRYLDQLEAFEKAGVRRVLYLQSFGCLKGHVQSRGALRDLAKRYPGLSITVVDYDPESSALNRENRIRLAVSS